MTRVPPLARGRLHRAELMDDPTVGNQELEHSLDQIATVTRFLGGLATLKQAMRRVLPARGEWSVLDVGTGAAAVPLALAAWGRRRGRPLRAVGVDLHAGACRVASERASGTSVSVVRGDALALPFADGSFDAVVATLTLHHFDDQASVRMLREMGRVARVAVLVGDLERSRANLWGANALAATLWRGNRITRHDGPLSVRRAFTKAELADLGTRAGLTNVRVTRHLPFRLALAAAPGRPPP